MSKRHSGIIYDELQNLSREYEKILRAEMSEISRELLLLTAKSNSANWSGGHSISNMAEQIARTIALELL